MGRVGGARPANVFLRAGVTLHEGAAPIATASWAALSIGMHEKGRWDLGISSPPPRQMNR